MTGACWTSTPGCSRLIWMVLNSLGLAALCIPKGACWLNLQEGWWRIFRRQALAGQAFADPDEIAHATQVATAQLNARARPWIWGRPQPKPRSYRRRFIYTL